MDMQAKIAAFVEREVSKAPPLSEEQKDIISRALHKVAWVPLDEWIAAQEPAKSSPSQSFDWDKELVQQAYKLGVKSPVAAVVDELQTKPGEWAILYSDVSRSMGRHYRARGCEVRRVRNGGSEARCTMFARWPEVSA